MLWSMSTTIRNPYRIYDFLSTISEIEGEEWTHSIQKKLQILLIKNRHYTPTPPNLSDTQIDLLKNVDVEMTYEQAENIFIDKQYKDSAMRGRTSFDPIEKLGLANLLNNKVNISDFGKMYLNNEIDLGEVVLSNFIKQQYPNPLTKGFDNWNTKPFINALRLIKLVNNKCEDVGIKQKGISKEEFGIFVLSLRNYNNIATTAEQLINYRIEKDKLSDNEQRGYVDNYIKNYLVEFKNPTKNVYEYTDNMIRYFRLTRFINIRGNGYYIDLEQRRMTEINALLENDNGSARSFSKEDWINFMGDYYAYELPWESKDKLTQIASDVICEVNTIEKSLNISASNIKIGNTKSDIKETIKEARVYRNKLQNQKIINDYASVEKIEETKYALENIRNLAQRASIELEKWTNIALNIINDSLYIKPNYPVGDDNEPTFTAPGNVPDIECYYENFNAICEVTMLTSRDQWINEGQPVQRHLREFEDVNDEKPVYCLFVAPRMHEDTINTFWNAVVYGYRGSKQRIVPLTINQLIFVLDTIQVLKSEGKAISYKDIKLLLDECVHIDLLSSSDQWQKLIKDTLNDWKSYLAA